MDDLYTRQVLDLTIRLAEVMLSSGSGTADVVATAMDVARAYRLDDCVVDITFTTIIVSAVPSPDATPVTLVRSVHTRATDYSRLTGLDRLVRRITAGGVSVEQAHEAMDELTERSHPYPRWLATAAWAGFALGIAMLLGGTWSTCLIAAVTTAAIDRLGRVLNRAGLPFFFQQAAGAGIATAVAVLSHGFTGQAPSVMVATGIVVLLSGLTLVASVQDALTGYMVTAAARLGDVIFMTAGIVVGIVIALQICTMVGVPIRLDVDVTASFSMPSRALPVVIAVIGAALSGMCLTLASYAPWRSILNATVASGLAEALLIGLAGLGFGQVVAAGLAAIGVGVGATLVSIRRGAPALVIATAGITPMLPGLAVFRAVYAFAVDGRFDDGLGQMLAAAATAVALGSGVVMGEFLGSPLRVGAGRLGDWLRVEGPPGLRRAVGRGITLRPARPVTTGAATATRSTGSVALVPVDAATADTALGMITTDVPGDPADSPDGSAGDGEQSADPQGVHDQHHQ
jgi:uncharacterized membrane protein YjjP (DUF1212 family)